MTNISNKTYHLFFTNLANELKISILLCLREKSQNVTQLSNDLGIEQSKVSHALSSLRCCNIVNVEQKGKQRIYSLNKKTIIPMLNLIDKHAKIHCKGKCIKCSGGCE
ncbi:MAG: ArsR/SmtB family transcription factor [Nanoarchaeota archaeon]